MSNMKKPVINMVLQTVVLLGALLASILIGMLTLAMMKIEWWQGTLLCLTLLLAVWALSAATILLFGADGDDN